MKFKKSLSFCAVFAMLLTTPVLAQTKEVLITGRGIGITLNSRGAIVSQTAQIDDSENNPASPAKDGGIEKGDIIVMADGEEVTSVTDLQKILQKSKGKEIFVKVNRGGAIITLKLKPVLSHDGEYRLGLWVKDSSAGIGTMTYYDPETNDFGALGHGITDSVSGALVEIDGGEVLSSHIVSLEKGEKGKPGELNGVLGEDSEKIGTVSKNTSCGVFGKMNLPENEIDKAQSIKVGKREDVRLGKAYILANVEDNKTEKFEIEISRIPAFTGDLTKGMEIKITDKKLIDKTGGIVRGMSGSPIVQSGRLIGAVTHVFINDPTRGYGIFIEDMFNESK